MRRPPVVLIVIALLIAGTGVGWAASSGDDPSLVAASEVEAAVDESPLPAEPVLSAAIEDAPAPLSPAPGMADDVDPAEVAATTANTAEHAVEPAPRQPIVADGDAPHLSPPPGPAAVDPAQAPTTTTAPAPTTPPSTTAAPAATVAFTAHQAYGSCEEPIPYDIFSGTATPGTTVTISSPYGSGSTTADGSGHWERTVEFPSAPRGETFTVTASGDGGSASFSFTATGESHG